MILFYNNFIRGKAEEKKKKVMDVKQRRQIRFNQTQFILVQS